MWHICGFCGEIETKNFNFRYVGAYVQNVRGIKYHITERWSELLNLFPPWITEVPILYQAIW
jgi:hypothetical protein